MVKEDKNAVAAPSWPLLRPTQSVQCDAETKSTDGLTYEVGSSNVRPLASQMTEAIILSRIHCSELLYWRGVYVSVPRNTSLFPVCTDVTRFHQKWSFGSVMRHWLIHITSNTININPYASVDGFPLICFGPNIQTHSCNQWCHEQFHVHLLAGVTHDIFTSVLTDKAFHKRHMMSDADVLGSPAWDSSVRPTNPFWNAVPRTETCFLLTTYCQCILMNTFALPKGF
jgi:hypothetical protein